MKIRNGFVTNSSSSSFICDVCNHVEAGYDMCLSEAGMYECTHGHTFCEDHVDLDKTKLVIAALPELLQSAIQCHADYKNDSYYQKKEKRFYNMLFNLKNLNEDEIDDIWEDEDLRSNIPESYCPICNLNSIKDDDFLNYITKKYSINIKDEQTKLREEFDTYSEFEKFLSK